MKCIATVSSKRDCELVRHSYGRNTIVRTELFKSAALKDSVKGLVHWVDPCFEVFLQQKLNEEANTFYGGLDPEFFLSKGKFDPKADKILVSEIAKRALEKGATLGPAWIGIPLLPIKREVIRKKLNRCLAESAAQWKLEKGFGGRLILPFVLENEDLIESKDGQDYLLRLIDEFSSTVSFDALWIVAPFLDDDSGRPRDQKLARRLVEFHGRVFATKARGSAWDIIAGPYWGLNIVLWAKGITDYPLVGAGRRFQYAFTGGVPHGTAKVRTAIPVLRRLAVVGPDLKSWLSQASSKPGLEHNVRDQFRKLEAVISSYVRSPEKAREQIIEFYSAWMESIERQPMQTRALALYQDLSNAYVCGKLIAIPLPKSESARRPEIVAQQLMLNVL